MIKILPDKMILDQIAEVERLREQCGAVKLPVSLSLALRKNSRKKSSYASNRIEGNPLTEAEASEAIESSKRHYLKPEQEIRNYYEALIFLQAARERDAIFAGIDSRRAKTGCGRRGSRKDWYSRVDAAGSSVCGL